VTYKNQPEVTVMAKVSCRYFVNVRSATNKDAEVVEVPDGLTVEQFLDLMSDKYGAEFAKYLYSTGTMSGQPFKTPNIHLNKRRIQWQQDFPEGVKTKVKDGDEMWFGLIVGGGALQHPA
jgi:molybdopterin converting factor small subunit